MTPVAFTLIVLGISCLAALLGSLVGGRGGIFIVPAPTLLLGVSIQKAIAASIAAVSIAAFARERDRAHVIITALVLPLLPLSFELGKGG